MLKVPFRVFTQAQENGRKCLFYPIAVVYVHPYLLVADADAAHTKSQTGAAVSANKDIFWHS